MKFNIHPSPLSIDATEFRTEYPKKAQNDSLVSYGEEVESSYRHVAYLMEKLMLCQM